MIVFLRLLEYYEGILFLTSNRVEAFDSAFKSRIHVALHYPELTLSVRRQLWRDFLLRIPENYRNLDLEADLDVLETEDINGRQIKNAVKMAGLLALADGGDLKPEHVEAVLKVMEEREARKARFQTRVELQAGR